MLDREYFKILIIQRKADPFSEDPNLNLNTRSFDASSFKLAGKKTIYSLFPIQLTLQLLITLTQITAHYNQ